jgi:ZIP family zinc transporter
LLGFLIFRTVFNDALFGISFALCAGIMVYVALNELLPVAKDYGEPSDAIIGVTIGMIVMAVSLIMMYA